MELRSFNISNDKSIDMAEHIAPNSKEFSTKTLKVPLGHMFVISSMSYSSNGYLVVEKDQRHGPPL